VSEPFANRGLADERTQLAWQRYSLGIAVIGLLSLRIGLAGHHQVAAFAVAFVLAAFAAALQYRGPRMTPHTAVQVALASTLTAAAGSILLALI